MGRYRENFVVELLKKWTITASNGYTYKDSPYYTKKDCLNPLDSPFLLFWFLLRCDAVDVAGEHRALLDIVNA